MWQGSATCRPGGEDRQRPLLLVYPVAAFVALLAAVLHAVSCILFCMGFRSLSGRRGRLYRRRRFKPKKNVFSGIWSALYLIMGFAAWLVWRQGGLRVQAAALCLYLLQLAVNLWAWPPIFVGGPRRRYAVADSAGIRHATAPCTECPDPCLASNYHSFQIKLVWLKYTSYNKAVQSWHHCMPGLQPCWESH